MKFIEVFRKLKIGGIVFFLTQRNIEQASIILEKGHVVISQCTLLLSGSFFRITNHLQLNGYVLFFKLHAV